MDANNNLAHGLRKVAGMLLLGLLAVFSLQNLGMARIEFLAWSVEAPRGLIYVMLFLAGGVAGLLIRHRKKPTAL